MYTFCQECETKKTSPILKKKILHLSPPPQKKTPLYKRRWATAGGKIKTLFALKTIDD